MKTGIKMMGAAIGVALGLAAFAPGPSVGEEVRSLRGDVPLTVDDGTPVVLQYKEGGEYARNYRQQPPLIPHRIEKYEIDLKVNQCLRCHDWSHNKEMGAPQVSETHYIDREGRRLDVVAGTRWFCTQCHVPQTDAKPLVDSDFRPASQSR